MKTSALLIALALAGGAAFAQSSTDSAAKAPDTASADAAKAAKPAKAKKSKKVKTSAAAGGAVMGAGPRTVETDLQATDRQARIDAAYANYKAKN